MTKVYELSDYRRHPPESLASIQATAEFLEDLQAARSRHPHQDILIAYACGVSKRLQLSVQMLARDGILTLHDLMSFTEAEFFQRYHFNPRHREMFLDKLRKAGAGFAEPTL